MSFVFQKPSAYKNLNSTQYTYSPPNNITWQSKFREFSANSLCKLS
jgi:hypothetical protein